MSRFWILILFLLLLVGTPANAATSDQYFQAGRTTYQNGDIDKASKYFKAATQVDPTNWKAYFSLGNCLYKLNQTSDAVDAYQKGLALHPDASVQNFVDKLKGQPGATVPASSGQGDQALLANFYAAKSQEDKSREGLKLYGQMHPLSTDEMYVANWGSPASDFREPHFDIEYGLWYADIGVNLDPTTNVGVEVLYLPISEAYYSDSYNSSGYYYDENITYLQESFTFFEPRIKFYSSPSGLSTYYGFGFAYMAFHSPVDPDGYQGTNFDLFAVSYLFGFRTLPKDGWTMELGFQMGVGIVFSSSQWEEENYSSATGYTYTPTTQSSSVPFPFVIPEWRFGYTF